MCPISDSEIHDIVQRVVQRRLGTLPDLPPIEQSLPPSAAPKPAPDKPLDLQAGAKRIVAIGADHGGYDLKEVIKKYLVELGYEVTDCGTKDKSAVDYPDFASAVASLISQGKAWRGIMIDGAGVGSCMVANKIPGVRAAMCYDYSSALNSREHNDANVLTLGAGLIGENLAKQIVKTWLSTEFLGGRHTPRVEKIMAVEKQYLKGGNS